uniref:Fibronectin type III and SPRY domain-containing protein 1 n=1 Tax=Gallus gallus TaxID=9031 RepID=A0A8V1AKB9_CHICK
MGDQEALRKIITTLAVKNEEIQNFIYSLKQMLQNVEDNSARVQEDLEGEFQSLYALLDELKDGMLMKIKQDRASRTYELQAQLAACAKALESSEELLEAANHTLATANNHDFAQAAKQIKDSVTMAPAFRLSLKAKVSDNMSHLMVDFGQERRLLQGLAFLPVPSTPEIDLAESLVADNCVTLRWRMPDEDSKIDHYVLEYRRTNFEGPPRAKEEQPWMVVEGIKGTEYTLAGLKFDMKYMNFRVRACNKAVAGEFSEAGHFGDESVHVPAGRQHVSPEPARGGLQRGVGRHGWEMQDVKAREKDGKGRTASPANSPARAVQSPKRMSLGRAGRDRFTAESYTVLGDTPIDGAEHYWEVRYDRDSKAFAAGVAYRSLGRFDPLGKTSASWCLHLNNWLQLSFSAKHANKAKALDGPVPECIGVYCNFHEGFLSFYNRAHQTAAAHLQGALCAAGAAGLHGLVRQFPGLIGPAGAQRCQMPPEAQQRGQQLHGQPALSPPHSTAFPSPPITTAPPPQIPTALCPRRAEGGWGTSEPPRTPTGRRVGAVGHP